MFYQPLDRTFRISIMDSRALLRGCLSGLFGAMIWLASEQMASAQVLLGQSGMAKSLVGWSLVALALLLGLLVVCRPSSRKWPGADQNAKRR